METLQIKTMSVSEYVTDQTNHWEHEERVQYLLVGGSKFSTKKISIGVWEVPVFKIILNNLDETS